MDSSAGAALPTLDGRTGDRHFSTFEGATQPVIFMSNALNPFDNDTRKSFDLGNGRNGSFYSLPALEQAGVGPVSKLPVSIRLVLESSCAIATANA
jgi:hypothetical protein